MPLLERIVVVLGAHAAAVRSGVDFHDAEPIDCAGWEEGMSASLRCGVGAVRGEAEAVMVLLGDQPRVTPQVIAMVADHRRRFTPAVRATYAGVPGHPVVIERELFDDVLALTGDHGARDLLAAVPVREVEVGRLCSGDDVDTPHELAALQRRRAVT